MRTLDLFTGIGGFSIGLEMAGGFEPVAFCECDQFCRAVLAKHWPSVPCHDDARTIEPPDVDLIVAGFPCQDVSHAGKRAGISAARSGLYREVVRCLRLVPRAFGLLENVAALLTRGMGNVLGDLAEIGRDAEWDCVPAGGIGALHWRDRVFITTFPRSDSGGLRLQRVWSAKEESWAWEQFTGLVQAELRISIPTGKSGGVADGFPGRMGALKGLGNAVVPQVVALFGRAIRAATASHGESK